RRTNWLTVAISESWKTWVLGKRKGRPEIRSAQKRNFSTESRNRTSFRAVVASCSRTRSASVAPHFDGAARTRRAAWSSVAAGRGFARCLAGFFEHGGHIRESFHFRVGQTRGRLALCVEGKTRTGRNQAANYNVFLQTVQVVALAAHRGIGQHPRGLLERRRRNERLGRQRGLGDAQQDRDRLGGMLAAGFRLAVDLDELAVLDLLATQIRGVAGFADLDLAQH